ncbi:50S ribosomal protein L9 [Candidatus Omnitrophota bacterium]
MEVILTQDLDKFGKTGSVIKVKKGFARNFLFPRNLAVVATPGNLKKIEQEARRIANLRERDKEKAQSLCGRLEGMSVTIPVAIHDEDQLYASITPVDIIKFLNQEGISGVEKEEQVILDEQIKSTGVYGATVKLHPEVTARIKVWVVKR